MMARTAAIIAAAGTGSRMNSPLPKQYLSLAGKPILIHTIEAFSRHSAVDLVVVVVAADWLTRVKELVTYWQLNGNVEVIAGGIRRQDSVQAGVNFLAGKCDIVLVHDGARPLVSAELISRCRDEAARRGAAIAAIPVKDTLKRQADDGAIAETVDRSSLWQAQTPQAARLDLLQQAFATAGTLDVTDEASLLELAAVQVMLVEGSESNLKITRPEDLAMAEKLLATATMPTVKIGHGYDAHRLTKGRRLVLAGVEIDADRGLEGHSDGDVATHALCDAILGALGRGDIGLHFPDSSSEYKDIYSILLLQRVVETMHGDGFTLNNADITIICQAPRLAPFVSDMKQTLAAACAVKKQSINIKATTTEKMGFTGRQEGISCHAVVALSAAREE